MAFLDVRHLTKEFIAERDFFGRAKKRLRQSVIFP